MDGASHPRVLLFPILLLPVLLLAVGLSWFPAAWGVFIKDMTQIVPLLVQMTLFLSPVFYPASAVPAILRPVYDYNPLGAVIEAARAAILTQPVSWTAWLIALAGGSLSAFLGHAFLQHSRAESSNVLRCLEPP